MSLIELIEQPGWEDALRRSLDEAIRLLQTDRFRLTASAVDDVRAWLAAGGAPHALERLREQLSARRLPRERQEAALAKMAQLLDARRRPLLDLMAAGIIPPSQEGLRHALDLSAGQLEDLWGAARAGGLAWEAALRAQGLSVDAIVGLRGAIDGWLERQGLRPPGDERLN